MVIIIVIIIIIIVFDNVPNQPSTFRIKNWIEIND